MRRIHLPSVSVLYTLPSFWPLPHHCIFVIFLGSGCQWKRHDEGKSVPVGEEAPSALCCEMKVYCKYLNVKTYIGLVLLRVLVICLLKILGPAPSGKRVGTVDIYIYIWRQSVTHPGSSNYRKKVSETKGKTVSIKGNIKMHTMTGMVVPACDPGARRILGQDHLGQRKRDLYSMV